MLRFLGKRDWGKVAWDQAPLWGKNGKIRSEKAYKIGDQASGAVVLGQGKGVRCRNVPVKSNANRSLFERANYIQLFREKLSEKCTRQSRRVLLVVLSLRQLQSPGTVY